MALFLWALVRVGAPESRAVTIPVQVRLNDPAWMVIGDPVPTTVEVRFSGSPAEIFRMTALDGVSIQVPVVEVRDEDMVIVLQQGWIPVDGYRGVQVEDIVPSTVHLHFDRIESVTLPVRITTRGILPEHLALTRSVSLRPSVVRVSGPAGLIERLDTLDIVPVDLAQVDERGVAQTSIDTTGLGRLTIVPGEVTLRIPVEESIERVLAGIPVVADLGPGMGPFEVLPSTVELTVTGARTRVSSLDPGLIRVLVPSYALQGLGESEERRVPIVVEGLPSYVSIKVGVDTVLVRRGTAP